MHQDRYINSADDLPSDTREYRFSGRSRARVSENGLMRRHLAAKKQPMISILSAWQALRAAVM